MLDRMLRVIALFGLFVACGRVDSVHLGKTSKSSLISSNLAISTNLAITSNLGIGSNLAIINAPNLTASLVSTSISSVTSSSGNSTHDPFLIDDLPAVPQNTKSKFYTVKNGTVNSLTAVKYKRNNTERSNEAGQSNQSKRDDRFTSFGCDLCTPDKNCSEGRTCEVYFKCSNSTAGHLNVPSDLHSNLSNLNTSFNLNSGLNADSIKNLISQNPIPPTNIPKYTLDSSLNSSFLPSRFLIAKQFYCDSICDCLQCEDEINCSLTKCDKPNEIMCQDKSSCIEPSKICDSSFDCKDHSDELGCCSVSYLFYRFLSILSL